MFVHGEVDEVDIIYTYFKSVMVQIPKTVPILPVQPKAKDALEVQSEEVWEADDPTDYPTLVFEPEPAEMLSYLAKYYLRSQILPLSSRARPASWLPG